MTKVSVVRCNNYDYNNVIRSIERSLGLIGGLDGIVEPGQRVLLKVNALAARKPEDAVTTHPSIVKAMIELTREAGAVPFVGDCCGEVVGGGTKRAMERSGIKAICEETKTELLYFDQEGFEKLKIPDGVELNEIYIAKPVLNADFVVSLPKLKTHVETMFTGALKNMFGVTSHGERKRAHSVSDYKRFSNALVDIYSVVKPGLAVMDAVEGMEGAGPSHGNAKKICLVMASRDPVALDAVSSLVVGFDIDEIATTKCATERNIGNGDISKIEVVGEALDDVRVEFKKPPTQLKPSLLIGAIRGLMSIEPQVNEAKCIGCGICAKSCPTGAAQINEKAHIDRDKCIRCYCCHELCPEGAVFLKKNFVYRGVEFAQELKERF